MVAFVTEEGETEGRWMMMHTSVALANKRRTCSFWSRSASTNAHALTQSHVSPTVAAPHPPMYSANISLTALSRYNLRAIQRLPGARQSLPSCSRAPCSSSLRPGFQSISHLARPLLFSKSVIEQKATFNTSIVRRRPAKDSSKQPQAGPPPANETQQVS